MNLLSTETGCFDRWGTVLLDGSGWLLVGCLVLAPLALGGTPWGAFVGITMGVWAVAGIGLVGLVLRGRRAVRLDVPSVCLLMLLAQGWLMGLNAVSRYDFEAGAFVELESTWPTLGGAVDGVAAYYEMALLSGLAGVFVVARRLLGDVVWRRRIWAAMVLTGAMVVGLGLLERLEVIEIFSRYHPQREGNFFGPYTYHANAASYINVILGLALGALGGGLGGGKLIGRWWLLALIWLAMLCVVGCIATGSRGGMLAMLVVLGVGGLILLGCCWKIKNIRALTGELGKGGSLGVVVGLLLGGVLLIGTGGQEAIARWKMMPEQLIEGNGRFEAWVCSFPLVAEAGALGHGPGSMKLLMPHVPTPGPRPIHHGLSKPHQPGTRVSMWNQLHQDYLQTLIEWGVVGSLLWGVVVWGGLWMGGRQIMKIKGGEVSFDACCRVGFFLGLVGLCTHAAFDFPLQVTSLRLYAVVMLAGMWGCKEDVVERGALNQRSS